MDIGRELRARLLKLIDSWPHLLKKVYAELLNGELIKKFIIS